MIFPPRWNHLVENKVPAGFAPTGEGWCEDFFRRAVPKWMMESSDLQSVENGSDRSKSRMNAKETLLKKLQPLIALVVMVVLLALMSDRFLTVANQRNILPQISVNLCLSIGMTLVILTGGIDLSVGATAGARGSGGGGVAEKRAGAENVRRSAAIHAVRVDGRGNPGRAGVGTFSTASPSPNSSYRPSWRRWVC